MPPAGHCREATPPLQCHRMSSVAFVRLKADCSFIKTLPVILPTTISLVLCHQGATSGCLRRGLSVASASNRLASDTAMLLSRHIGFEGQAKPIPDRSQAADEITDKLRIVMRRGCDAKTLGTVRHGRIVDGLYVNAEFLKEDA